MNRKESKKFRDAACSLFQTTNFKNPVAVTLTMKQCCVFNGSRFPLTDTGATQNLRHFRNLVNRKIFGKAGVRKKRQMNCYAFVENKNVRPHYHLCLDKPDDMTMEQFTVIIHRAWSKTYFGYYEIDVKACDSGWISYMMKDKTKLVFADSIDWLNYYNSERAV